MFDYLVMYTTKAEQAGLDTSTLVKSLDGAQCIIHKELVPSFTFNLLLIFAMMSGQPFSVCTLEEINALTQTESWR